MSRPTAGDGFPHVASPVAARRSRQGRPHALRRGIAHRARMRGECERSQRSSSRRYVRTQCLAHRDPCVDGGDMGFPTRALGRVRVEEGADQTAKFLSSAIVKTKKRRVFLVGYQEINMRAVYASFSVTASPLLSVIVNRIELVRLPFNACAWHGSGINGRYSMVFYG